MIILDSNTDFEVKLSGAIATNQSNVYVSYHDAISTGDTFAPQAANTNSAAPVVICTRPAASNYRLIKNIELRNEDTAAITATFRTAQASLSATCFKVTLQPGDNATYEDGAGWIVTDHNGGQKSIASYNGYRLMKAPSILTTGTSYTIPSGCTAIQIELIAGGGGGGGTSTVAGKASGAGASGGYLKAFIVNPQTTAITIAIALGGTATSGAGGSAGGDTTFTCNSVTYTSKGGTGGHVANTAPPHTNVGGTGVVPTNGDINDAGMPGDYGLVVNATANMGITAFGGALLKYGTPGRATSNAANVAGTGFGAGGSGVLLTTSSSQLGGAAGRPGLIIIHEYTT